MSYLILEGGDSATLKSQLEACSYDQLNIIPGDNNAPEMNGKRGVYEVDNGGGGPNSGTMTVTIDVPLTGDVTRNQIHNDAKLKVEQALGFSLPGPFEQVKHGPLPTEMRVFLDDGAGCFLFSNLITLYAPGAVRGGEVLHFSK